MMRWFGVAPFSPACEDVPHVPTPVGVPCSYCDDPIEPRDRGYYYSGDAPPPVHYECFIRQIIGSVGHQQKRCSCFGGHTEDPIGVSRHEAARLAVALWEATHGGGRHF